MLKKLSRNQIAKKMGLSISFVDCLLSRPEFHKLNIDGFFIINSAFKDSVKDFLKIRLLSTKTKNKARIKYSELIKNNLSCLDN